MTKTLLVFCMALLTITSYAQTKKPHAKKPTTKVAPKEETTSLNAATAGKFAKDFGEKMYNAIDFEEKKSGYNFSINRWKPYRIYKDDGTTEDTYFVDVTVSWKSAQGGWPTTWKDVRYKGIMMFDQFGCDAFFMIKERVEPSSKGLNILVVHRSPVAECTPEMKTKVESLDSWCDGVTCAWSPNGCLN